MKWKKKFFEYSNVLHATLKQNGLIGLMSIYTKNKIKNKGLG